MEELNHLHWNIELHVKVESNKKKMRKLGVKSHEYTPRAKPINNNNNERSKIIIIIITEVGAVQLAKL